MAEESKMSRRKMLAGLTFTSIGLPSAEASDSDSRLLLLGRRFDEIAFRLDEAIDGMPELSDELVNDLGRICGEVANEAASTMEGLFVKAKMACWSVLGDLDVSSDLIEEKMGMSIIRDLILHFEPKLYEPGELKRLAES